MPNSDTRAVPKTTATIEPGTRGASRLGQNTIVNTEPSARAAVGHCKVPKFSPSAFIFSTTSAGTGSSFNPKKSLIWVLKIKTAMPHVKPIVTG